MDTILIPQLGTGQAKEPVRFPVSFPLLTLQGIGGGIDSFYEYLLKGSILFDIAYYEMLFKRSYDSIIAVYVPTSFELHLITIQIQSQ